MYKDSSQQNANSQQENGPQSNTSEEGKEADYEVVDEDKNSEKKDYYEILGLSKEPQKMR